MALSPDMRHSSYTQMDGPNTFTLFQLCTEMLAANACSVTGGPPTEHDVERLSVRRRRSSGQSAESPLQFSQPAMSYLRRLAQAAARDAARSPDEAATEEVEVKRLVCFPHCCSGVQSVHSFRAWSDGYLRSPQAFRCAGHVLTVRMSDAWAANTGPCATVSVRRASGHRGAGRVESHTCCLRHGPSVARSLEGSRCCATGGRALNNSLHLRITAALSVWSIRTP